MLVCLFAPQKLKWLGGVNSTIAEEKTIQLEITPPVLGELLDRRVTVEGMPSTVHYGYNVESNTVMVKSSLPNENTLEKIRELEGAGWVFKKSVCRSYGLEW